MRLSAAVMFLVFSFPALAQVESSAKALAPVPQENPPASSDVLNRILALIAESGSDSELPAWISDSLGFSNNNQPWPDRLISVRSDESDLSSPLHFVAISRGADENVLILTKKESITRFIRTLRDGHAVKAIAIDTVLGKASMIATADAQSEVNAEFQFWERNVEKAAHWLTCTGELGGAHPVTAEKKIAACTWIIQSGMETPHGVAMAYTNRGMAYKDNIKQEMKDLMQSVKLNPMSARAWAQLCSAQNWVSENTKLAIQSCSKAIELDPNSPEAWTYRGDIYLRQKNYDLAIIDYGYAIKLEPDWMWPLDNRGEAYLRKNQFDRAIEDFNAVIRVSPDYAMGFLDRGIAEMRKNDLDAALADFQMGIKVDPKCGACLLGQGLVKRAKGDNAGGDADIAKAKSLSPKASDNFVKDGIPVP
ncbi:MAG: tetratricopeptide repeat protein [Terracidiphilus sp.]